jgi:hypothetical protein
MPRLIDPEARTAMQPLRPNVHYRPVSMAASIAPAAATLDVGGWRASSD